MPEIRISDPSLLQELAADLRERSDTIVGQAGEDRLVVHVVGSYNDEALRLVTYLRVRAWEAAQRARGHDVSVEIVD